MAEGDRRPVIHPHRREDAIGGAPSRPRVTHALAHPYHPHMHRALLAALVLTATAACTTTTDPEPVSVVAIGSPDAAARAMRTYAWSPTATIVPDDPAYDAARLESTLRTAIADVMTARGYRLAPPDAADRHIAYALGLSTILDDERLARTFGFTPGTDTDNATYGTLVIAILDPRTGTPLYRAGMQALARPGATERQRQERIDDAVQRLIGALPPAAP